MSGGRIRIKPEVAAEIIQNKIIMVHKDVWEHDALCLAVEVLKDLSRHEDYNGDEKGGRA